METELHPLRPFLPRNARLLMLGSFPPPRKRWSMDFFYPNWNNDMWRVWGLIARGDRDSFVMPGERRFDRGKIEAFCRDAGLALYDTAEEVVRLRNNASDNHLQIVRPVNLAALLEAMPGCMAVAATGQKSAETLQSILGFDALPVGGSCTVQYAGRRLTVWRMPSTSRAYPRPIEWKAEFYRAMAVACGMKVATFAE